MRKLLFLFLMFVSSMDYARKMSIEQVKGYGSELVSLVASPLIGNYENVD